jgi:hypothetical protein
MHHILEQPISIEVSQEKSLPETERQTIVHCTLQSMPDMYGTLVRIWPTTYLVQENGVKKQLLYFEQITGYPMWMPVRLPHTFTLIFEGLDNSCTHFDLIEEIPESGGFEVSRIPRNEMDVYRVKL